MDINKTLQAVLAAQLREKQIEDEAFRLGSPYSDQATKLFSVRNSKLNHFFVLANDKQDALKFLENSGHIVSRKLARIKIADPADWVPEMSKFFAAVAQASASRAQGIVTNSNGFAVMKNTGTIFMPLTVVTT